MGETQTITTSGCVGYQGLSAGHKCCKTTSGTRLSPVLDVQPARTFGKGPLEVMPAGKNAGLVKHQRTVSVGWTSISDFCKVSVYIEGIHCIALVNTALSSNPSHLKELDLTYNHPGEEGVTLLSSRLEDPNCSLNTLRLDHGGEIRIQPGVKKYSREITLDQNTAFRCLFMSDGNRKFTPIISNTATASVTTLENTSVENTAALCLKLSTPTSGFAAAHRWK
ncbi:hypothetical protein MHYP_G00090590 [Metynnis hypsauchen]